ncbi:hypothetical protein CLV46_2951 [Diaminobutyricimonas aerilata]|uniref:2-oxoglutarate-Fe(II)-dependent oxygenase superfamily protein n=1 Tax=Diaminobutyricimonas aerilata TaxID=1162967 RepID=A0A2M9CND6_9MICO|nr:hypothetical protein [Diaminobutyricimonas aerilata]PJJ73364.1 hypothetical protein CLV46_2951 [Diaminobutyricimonas aerilata]
MSYIRSAAFDETGYVILDAYDQASDPKEWLDLEYVDWRSSGVTRFAPLASAFGEMEVDGFWNHTPPRTDKDGVWVRANVEKAPRLKARAEEPGANVGRCRVIELQPNGYADALFNQHQDDNNRLNPDNSGWIVRGFFNLSDDRESLMILREDRLDPSTETRIALPAGTQLIVDTQRLWHSVWHQGTEPRYCLITSWESGRELDAYIERWNGRSRSESAPLAPGVQDAAQRLFEERLEARARAQATRGRVERGAYEG